MARKLMAVMEIDEDEFEIVDEQAREDLTGKADINHTHEGLVTAEDQTFEGNKLFNGNVGLYSDGTTARGFRVVFNDEDKSDLSMSVGRGYYIDGQGVTHYYPNRWNFFVHSRDPITRERLDYYEVFSFPIVNHGLTQNMPYNIWTTKSIPEPPAANGTYTLKATVNNGVTTYFWE